MLPLCVTRTGEFRSDGTLMACWGGDPRIGYCASAPDAPDFVAVETPFIASTAVPSLKVVGWNGGTGGIVSPGKLVVHRGDLAVVCHGDSLIQRGTANLDAVGRLVAAGRDPG